MSSIRKHVPCYVEADCPTAQFNTKEELLAIPWVKEFTEGHQDFGSFYRFSIDVDKLSRSQTLLMAEYNLGSKWLVVGFLELNHIEGLPKWEPK